MNRFDVSPDGNEVWPLMSAFVCIILMLMILVVTMLEGVSPRKFFLDHFLGKAVRT